MRMMYLTDIHDDLAGVERVLRASTSDFYVVAGDLIYRAFKTDKTLFRFFEIQEQMRGLRRRMEFEGSPYELADEIARAGDRGDEHLPLAREYRRLVHRARENMLRRYEDMEALFARHPDKPIFVLPGNYDMNLAETALAHRDLHLRVHEVEGLRIAGYGGAQVFTPGIPESLIVKFNESRDHGRNYSEAYDFFMKTRPDMAVTHHPPYGIFDKLAHYGNIGSPGLRQYVDTGYSKILLTGHMHENWGVELHAGTVCVNPSNFGKAQRPGKLPKGSYFCGIRLHAGFFLACSLRQVEGEGYRDIVDYYPTERGIRELILDPHLYMELGEFKPRRERHVREVRIFNRVKSYFRGYDTDESRRRIAMLRRLYRDFAERGVEIAFDVMGSTNFGMTERTSDLDLVMYLRDTRVEAREHFAAEVPEEITTALAALSAAEGFPIHLVDAINLQRVLKAIHRRDPEDLQLERFVLYRAIGRPVNIRMLAKTEALLAKHANFKYAVERKVRDFFRSLIRTSEHAYSFKKYEVRLHTRDITIPPSVERIIREHLGVE
ncbi:MAG: metallophosphoesterase [Myxococcales bacterium]|nr:metallophosphoesterase [Myxococcales bacterium]